MGIGLGQILIVFMLALLFFGAKRLPEIARAMGKAANEFRKAKDDIFFEDSEPEPRCIASAQPVDAEVADEKEPIAESMKNGAK